MIKFYSWLAVVCLGVFVLIFAGGPIYRSLAGYDILVPIGKMIDERFLAFLLMSVGIAALFALAFLYDGAQLDLGLKKKKPPEND